MPKLTVIYNPLAGALDLVSGIEDIAGDWRNLKWEVAVEPTREPGHATVLAAAAAAQGVDVVLAAGGDGTLGEVVNGLAESNTIMGIIPAGTANSFARELEMPVPSALQVPVPQSLRQSRLRAVSTALAAGRVKDMDLGYRLAVDEQDTPGKYWMLWASTGADGFLVNEVEPRPKWSKKFGWSSYLLQGIAVLSHFSHIRATIEVDGYQLRDDYILVLISNSRRYAGGILTLTQQACVDDGLFEVWLFGGHGLSSISRHAFHALRGQHLQEPDTILLRGEHVSIVSEPPMPVQMDGDPAAPTPMKCVIKPGALRLLVPDTAALDSFQKPGTLLADVVGH